MPVEIAELVALVLVIFIAGLFFLLMPISRRLGRALEEWVKLRRESSPDRDLLARIETELRELRSSVESLDQRVELLGERQDFTESLIESKRKAIAPDS